MQINHGPPSLSCSLRCRNPPTLKPRRPGVRHREGHRIECQSRAGRCFLDSRQRVIEQLPAPLPEKQAQCEPTASGGGRNHYAHGREQPSARDKLRLRVISAGAALSTGRRPSRHNLQTCFIWRHDCESRHIRSKTCGTTSILTVDAGNLATHSGVYCSLV
jgi:hypothetical protein